MCACIGCIYHTSEHVPFVPSLEPFLCDLLCHIKFSFSKLIGLVLLDFFKFFPISGLIILVPHFSTSVGLPFSWYPLTSILHLVMTTFSHLSKLSSTSHISHQSQSSFSHVLTYLYHYCSCPNIPGLIPSVPFSPLLIPFPHLISLLSSIFFEVNPKVSTLLSKSCFAVPNYLNCLTFYISMLLIFFNCGIRHVTVPLATRILIANVRHIGVSNICVINLVYFKMQV